VFLFFFVPFVPSWFLFRILRMLEDSYAADEDLPEEDDGVVPCPYCSEEMLEDSPRCPSCGRYISEEDRPPERKPPWILIGVVLCLIVALMWIAGR